MRRSVTAAMAVALVVLFLAPTLLLAQTRVVYASGPTLDQVILADTTAGGFPAHSVYQLVSLDTTYIFDGTITFKSGVSVIGVPDPTTGKLPCIQPDVLPDNSIPGLLFTLTGKGGHYTFKNLYLLGIAINNVVNYGGGQAIQVSADSLRLVVDNVVFEQWSQFAIGYSGSWDKFFITNCKFRNMTTQPTQWYVGEVLRNENYLGKFPTDSIYIRYNTMLCVSGYAACPVTAALVNYFEFSHNSVIYTFKNPFFIFNVTHAKINDNIFYGTYAGGVSMVENPWWDNLWFPDTSYGVVALEELDSLKITVFAPGHPPVPNGQTDTTAERLRVVEVKNNVCFWPSGLTSFHTAWNDTATVLRVILASWMNARTVNMFTDKNTWPGLTESGSLSVDPGYGPGVNGVLDPGTGVDVGLLNWFRVVRLGTGTTEIWGYKTTQVGSAANWTPQWPLPETADMKYSNGLLLTGGTDGRPVGDPWWFNGTNGGPTSAERGMILPNSFELSAPYPNPFNPTTHLNLSLVESGVVTFKVYNIMGQEVATIINGELRQAGVYTLSVDLSHLSSGVYFGIVEQGMNRATQKLVLMK